MSATAARRRGRASASPPSVGPLAHGRASARRSPSRRARNCARRRVRPGRPAAQGAFAGGEARIGLDPQGVAAEPFQGLAHRIGLAGGEAQHRLGIGAEPFHRVADDAGDAFPRLELAEDAGDEVVDEGGQVSLQGRDVVRRAGRGLGQEACRLLGPRRAPLRMTARPLRLEEIAGPFPRLRCVLPRAAASAASASPQIATSAAFRIGPSGRRRGGVGASSDTANRPPHPRAA